MFENLKRVKAWIPIDGTYDMGEGPKMAPEAQEKGYPLSKCITCGICLEVCPQVNENSNFVGAAIVSQVRLFNMHPTGAMHAKERLEAISGRGGVQDCGNAQNCVHACPKSIPLTESIAEVNRDAIRQTAFKLALRLSFAARSKCITHTKYWRAGFWWRGFAFFERFLAMTSRSARKKLHFSSIVLDTHDDTPQRMLFEHFDLGHRDSEGQIDIPRMREGGLNAIFFSIWCPATLAGPAAEKRAFDLIDSVLDQVRKHPQDLVLATTAEEVRRAHTKGKIAVLMGVEGGHMINNDLAVLRKFAALGVRYMTLTHTLDTDWAGSSG